DAVQTNIRPNHVAIVKAGRAGPECGIRLDSGAGWETITHEDEDTMKLEEALQKLAEANVRIEQVTQERDAQKSRADVASADLAIANIKLAEAEKARNDAASPEAIAALVRARTAVVNTASKWL